MVIVWCAVGRKWPELDFQLKAKKGKGMDGWNLSSYYYPCRPMEVPGVKPGKINRTVQRCMPQSFRFTEIDRVCELKAPCQCFTHLVPWGTEEQGKTRETSVNMWFWIHEPPSPHRIMSCGDSRFALFSYHIQFILFGVVLLVGMNAGANVKVVHLLLILCHVNLWLVYGKVTPVHGPMLTPANPRGLERKKSPSCSHLHRCSSGWERGWGEAEKR